jgi:hypothetical protein
MADGTEFTEPHNALVEPTGTGICRATRLFDDPPLEDPKRIRHPDHQAETERRVQIYTAQCEAAGGWTKNVQHIWWINKAVASTP